MHYYHYTLDMVLEMDLNKYHTLAKLMYMNQARDTLKDLNTSLYPKLSKEGRADLHRRYFKAAYPAQMEPKNVVKLGDLSKVVNG
jgi:hypothetical protein